MLIQLSFVKKANVTNTKRTNNVGTNITGKFVVQTNIFKTITVRTNVIKTIVTTNINVSKKVSTNFEEQIWYSIC
jgi:hypothetical protein